jgi:HlyD family secretion protein
MFPHNREMKTTIKRIGWAVALGLSALMVYVLVTKGTAVEVALVSQGPMVQSVVTSGRIATAARTEVASQSTALIEFIDVREGDVVQAGQVLVRLRDDEAQAALQQSDATVAEARMRIRQIQTVQGPVSDQQLKQAEATNQQAQQELLRTQNLLKQGFVSQSRLDDVQRAASASQAVLLAANAQANANQPGGVEVALAQARLTQALAAQSVTAARLDQLNLRAPVAATVIARLADPGDTAQAGKAILTLVGNGETRINASVDEKNLKFLQLGQMAHATSDAYTDRQFAAQLTYIAPSVDPQRGTVELRLAVAPPVAFLRPDMTVSVEIITAQVPNALKLPSGAIQRDTEGNTFVLVSRDGRAHLVVVKTGLQGIGSTQITQGLTAGESVILPGPAVNAGDRVREQQP